MRRSFAGRAGTRCDNFNSAALLAGRADVVHP
jgi:hypothetical protein